MSDLLDKLATETHLNMILCDALVASTNLLDEGFFDREAKMAKLIANEAIDLESGKALLNANKKPIFVRPNMRYANGKKVSAGSKYFWTDIDSLVWIPSQPNKDRLTKHLQLTGEIQ